MRLFNHIILMEKSAHIYLIQDGNDKGTNIFKIGMTIQGECDEVRLKRFSGYSRGTIQYNTWRVSHEVVREIETKIKQTFRCKYHLVRGTEWFEGDVKQMKKDIDHLIDNDEKVQIVSFPKIQTIYREWQKITVPTPYKEITTFLEQSFDSMEGIKMFKEYMVNILDHMPNQYGVLIIPGSTIGDGLLNILRTGLGKYYNSSANSRNSIERIIRYTDIGIQYLRIIKQNTHCHHVYLWDKEIYGVKETYEKSGISYTICPIKKTDGLSVFGWYLSQASILSMLSDFVAENHL